MDSDDRCAIYVALRHNKLVITEQFVDHLIAGEPEEYRAVLGDERAAHAGMHQVQALYFEAVIAQRQREGVTLAIKRMHEVQHESAEGLVIVRPAQHPRQRHCS